MRRVTLSVFTASVLSVLVLGPAQAATPKLTGEVGPSFTIEVKMGNKDVKKLKAGKYTIKVEDKGTIHDFHLFGPGVNKKTGVSFTGDQTWKITLKPGRYTYQCDPHAASGMKGHFTVTK